MHPMRTTVLLLGLLAPLLCPLPVWAQVLGAGSVNITTGAITNNPGGADGNLQINTSGAFAAYAGTSCTNQFPRSLNAAGTATCASVAAADIAALTSAQLATILTNETGTGVAVFNSSPTLVTPVLGAATATSLTTPLVALGTASTTTGAVDLFNGASAFKLTLQSASIATADRTVTFADPGGAKTVAYLQSPSFTTPTLGVATATSLTTPLGVLGVASTTTGALDLFNAGSAFKLTLQSASVATADRVVTFPDPGAAKTVAYLESPSFTTPALGVATGTSFQGLIGNVTPAAGTFTALIATPSLTFVTEVASTVSVARSTTAATNGAGLTLAAAGATSGSTDKNGGALTLTSGLSTGAGASSIILRTSGGGTTGTGDKSLVTALTVQGTGQVLLATTAFAALGTPAVATITYCPDCDAPAAGAMATCTSAGTKTGAWAFRVNATPVWGCIGI